MLLGSLAGVKKIPVWSNGIALSFHQPGLFSTLELFLPGFELIPFTLGS